MKVGLKPRRKMMKKVLLVEPFYRSKYPPLGLMKISTYHKNLGDIVCFARGIKKDLNFDEFDMVYITSLYTFEADEVNRTINYYRQKCHNADVRVGGIYASLMPEHICTMTGIMPHVGLWMDVEMLPPDYSLTPFAPYSDHSFVFTTRGCPNRCGFCAVKTTEPELFVNSRWKEHISLKLPKVMVHDNNITAAGFNHFKEVMDFLAAIKKPVTFDNGFDCRKFTELHCRLLSKIKINSIRFAFDSMAQEGYIQRAILMCGKHGIKASKIMVYVLFNYKDTIENALYRAREIAKLGAKPYAMQYVPLDSLTFSKHYNKYWNKELCEEFFYFINILGFANAMPFEEWRAKWKKKRFKEASHGR